MEFGYEHVNIKAKKKTKKQREKLLYAYFLKNFYGF